MVIKGDLDKAVEVVDGVDQPKVVMQFRKLKEYLRLIQTIDLQIHPTVEINLIVDSQLQVTYPVPSVVKNLLNQ